MSLVGATRIKEFEKKIKNEFAKRETDQIKWLHKIRPSLDTWINKLSVISVVCDPGMIIRMSNIEL